LPYGAPFDLFFILASRRSNSHAANSTSGQVLLLGPHTSYMSDERQFTDVTIDVTNTVFDGAREDSINESSGSRHH